MIAGHCCRFPGRNRDAVLTQFTFTGGVVQNGAAFRDDAITAVTLPTDGLFIAELNALPP